MCEWQVWKDLQEALIRIYSRGMIMLYAVILNLQQLKDRQLGGYITIWVGIDFVLEVAGLPSRLGVERPQYHQKWVYCCIGLPLLMENAVVFEHLWDSHTYTNTYIYTHTHECTISYVWLYIYIYWYISFRCLYTYLYPYFFPPCSLWLNFQEGSLAQWRHLLQQWSHPEAQGADGKGLWSHQPSAKLFSARPQASIETETGKDRIH